MTAIATDDQYMVTVDYTKSLADMIDAGNYDGINSQILEQDFPIQQTDIENSNTKLFLVHLNRVVTEKDVLDHMDKMGLRPARIEELLALGQKYPDLQRQFPIAAFGSIHVGPDGHHGVPCLYKGGSTRNLDLWWIIPPDDRWHETFRFVAVSK